MLPQWIKTPNETEFRVIVQGFRENWGFPQCGGAIDGTHIDIIAPADNPADYYNRKGSYSIILLGVVDDRFKFWDINVGWPGRVPDARVFANSSLYQRDQSGTLFPTFTERMEGVDIPLVLLGDSAYPLLPWLMKPFPERAGSSPLQHNLNYRPSRARMVVERAFGHLEGRWRCLLKRCDNHIAFLSTIVSACYVLHNFCEAHAEDYQEMEEQNEDPGMHQHMQADHNSNATRDALASHFSRH